MPTQKIYSKDQLSLKKVQWGKARPDGTGYFGATWYNGNNWCLFLLMRPVIRTLQGHWPLDLFGKLIWSESYCKFVTQVCRLGGRFWVVGVIILFCHRYICKWAPF